MNKKEFLLKIIDILNSVRKVDEFLDKAAELNIDLIDTPLFEAYGYFLDRYVEELLGHDENKIDTLNWYIFEYRNHLADKGLTECKENAEMWDEAGNPICYDAASLVDYLVNA